MLLFLACFRCFCLFVWLIVSRVFRCCFFVLALFHSYSNVRSAFLALFMLQDLFFWFYELARSLTTSKYHCRRSVVLLAQRWSIQTFDQTSRPNSKTFKSSSSVHIYLKIQNYLLLFIFTLIRHDYLTRVCLHRESLSSRGTHNIPQ